MFRKVSSVVTILTCLCWVFTALAQSSGKVSETERNLRRIRARIVQTEAELRDLKKEAADVSTSLDDITREFKQLKKDEEDSVKMLGTLATQIEAVSLQIGDVHEQINSRRGQVKDRLSSMYKTRRRLSPLSFLFLSSGVQSFYRRADYLRRLVKNDSEQINDFVMLLETLRSSNEEFAHLKNEEERTLKQIKESRSLISQKQLEQARVSRELSKKLEQKQVVLDRYRDEARQLEELLQGVMGGGIKSEELETVIPSIPSPSFSGGRLPFPVKGTIVQHFGKQKHDEFAETIFVKGIEVASTAGAEVRVVSDGTVVFDSELPVFGNVLIVEHPGRYFTLYGRISPLKTLGDQLKGGDVIARTSAPDDRGRNFYFEIRKEGKPQNPEKYFGKN